MSINMINTLKLTFVATAALILASCSGKSVPQLRNQQDTLSWAMGENIALSLQQMNGIDLDNELVQQAIANTLGGGERVLSDSALSVAMDFIVGAQQVEMIKRSNELEKQVNQQQQQFFAQLEKDHPQVKKHPSGFYFEVLKEGTGRRPEYGERVSFDYRSFKMFTHEPWDQTYGKRDPILHSVGKPMFQGLVDGLQLMRAGSIYRFYFPYQLAFGVQGSGDIEGCMPFIYEVELHTVYDD